MATTINFSQCIRHITNGLLTNSVIMLFVSITILSYCFSFEVKAMDTTITNFPPTDFWKVNNTRKIPGVLPDTIGSFFWYLDTNFDRRDTTFPNMYQLTDTFKWQSVAMWHKDFKIDLSKNFEFEYRFYWDTGKAGSVYVGEGLNFVLHTNDNPVSMIGMNGAYRGYGWDTYIASINNGMDYGADSIYDYTQCSHITPSFSIGFNSRANTSTPYNHGFLAREKNAFPHPAGWTKTMQNLIYKKAIGEWYPVKIRWQKESNGGYSLLTYVVERLDTTHLGDTILRDSMYFSSISDVIDGLEIDDSCHAWVNWGITAGTSDYGEPDVHGRIYYSHVNHQLIEFISLRNWGEDDGASSHDSVRVYLVGYPHIPGIIENTDEYAPGYDRHPIYRSVPCGGPQFNQLDTFLRVLTKNCYF